MFFWVIKVSALYNFNFSPKDILKLSVTNPLSLACKMAYSGEEEEGFACSFSIYLAEGDALAKQGDFVKAIHAYTIALEIQPDDKNCLVAR